MFDLGWSEMMLIGVVALIVVGPKELPACSARRAGRGQGARHGARVHARHGGRGRRDAACKEIDRTIRAATRPVQFATDRCEDARWASPPAPATPLAAGTPLDPGTPIKPRRRRPTALAARPRAGARRARPRPPRAERRAADAERRAAEAERRGRAGRAARAAPPPTPATDEPT